MAYYNQPNGKATQRPEDPAIGKLGKAVKPVARIADFANKPIKAYRVTFVWDEDQQGIPIELPESFFITSEVAL